MIRMSYVIKQMCHNGLTSSLFIALTLGFQQTQIPIEYELKNQIALLGDSQKGAELYQPLDFVLGNADTAYVVDYGDKCVVAFNLDGNLLFRFGRSGQGPGEFLAPRAIAFNSNTVYVVDSQLSRISEFGADGSFNRTIRMEDTPSDIVIHNHHAYVGTVGLNAPLIRISLDNPNEQIPLLYKEFEDRYPYEIEDPRTMGKRMSMRMLMLSNDHLFVGFKSYGEIAILPLDGKDQHVRWLKLTSPLIDEYWKHFNKHYARVGEEQGGAYIPTVLWSLSEWIDGNLLCTIRTRGGERYLHPVVVFSKETGSDTGIRLNMGHDMQSGIRLMKNGLFGWIDYESATIVIHSIGPVDRQF